MQTKRTPKQPTSPMGPLSRALCETPSPREAKPKDWQKLEKLYVDWQVHTPEARRQKYWYDAKALRLGRLTEAAASPEARMLRLFEEYRVYNDRRKRREKGFDAKREKRRKAKDPAAYRAANAKRQRDHRARVKQAAAQAAELYRQLEQLEDGTSEAAFVNENADNDVAIDLDPVAVAAPESGFPPATAALEGEEAAA